MQPASGMDADGHVRWCKRLARVLLEALQVCVDQGVGRRGAGEGRSGREHQPGLG